MKKSYIACFATLCCACLLLIGCSDDDDNTPNSQTPVPTTQNFDFRTDDPGSYVRVDRIGMPAIATALIDSDDSYNEANPSDDLSMQNPFVAEILANLDALHTALDNQLMDLSLTPCTVVGDGTGTCATAAVPLIIPDTLKINTSADAGFPNGRKLTDPVIAVTLAVALLELTGDMPAQTAVDLVGVVNPTANDLELPTTFPFLANPHQAQ